MRLDADWQKAVVRRLRVWKLWGVGVVKVKAFRWEVICFDYLDGTSDSKEGQG